MAVKLKKWDVAEQLDTEEEMQLYLEACAEEDDGDVVDSLLSCRCCPMHLCGDTGGKTVTRVMLLKAKSWHNRRRILFLLSLSHRPTVNSAKTGLNY